MLKALIEQLARARANRIEAEELEHRVSVKIAELIDARKLAACELSEAIYPLRVDLDFSELGWIAENKPELLAEIEEKAKREIK